MVKAGGGWARGRGRGVGGGGLGEGGRGRGVGQGGWLGGWGIIACVAFRIRKLRLTTSFSSRQFRESTAGVVFLSTSKQFNVHLQFNSLAQGGP